MVIEESVSFWIGIIGTTVGVISLGVAIYQWAQANAGKKRSSELQYILAGINNAALQKQQAWQNQINTLPKLESAQDWEMGRLYLRAKDDFTEIASLAIALEGSIDIHSSAIKSMLTKSIEIIKLNNELQRENMKNPIHGNVEPNEKEQH